MKCPGTFIRSQVNIQPVFRLVDFFSESTEYERNWKLPFNSLCLCARENPHDPSWVELPEKGMRLYHEKNVVYFTTCDTPMRIRYTTANLHLCIHFRYELFPGVDLFSLLHERYVLQEKKWAGKISRVFAEPNPMKRLAEAKIVAMEIVVKYWPEHLPLDLERMARFSSLLQYVNEHLDSRMGIAEMAAMMGWSEAYFSRMFHSVFHITPKQYLIRQLYARAVGLLNNPQKSVKEVAFLLKFSTEFNFSRFIRHYSGHSPSDIRHGFSNPMYVRK